MTTSDHEPDGAPEQSGSGGLVDVTGAGGPVAGDQQVATGTGPDPVRLRLEVAYDGAGFCGWARQPGLRSVQGELEAALRAVLRIEDGIPVRVAVAGRTDAGVHATGQVCHADIPAAAWAAAGQGRSGEPVAQAVRRRCNGALGPDVRVRQVQQAAPGFDARWSALWRSYRYLVADDPAGQDPRARGNVLWNARPLDVAAMHASAQDFLGEHDFAAFCRAREGASSVRTVHEIVWTRVPAMGGEGGAGEVGAGAATVAQFSIRADAFCHSMVRSLVGAFLAVGEGRWPVGRPGRLLVAGVREHGIASAPPHGLTLVGVGYPADAELADQARRARRWRGR